jgi:hypothetical protein
MPDRRRFLHTFLILAFACSLPALGAPRKLVRVPQDAQDLATAIRLVKDGDVIELAGGTYLPPSKGFTLQNLGKAFTIRPAAGATAILDGKGKGTILRIKNGSRSRGKRVTFERLTFQNGFSKTEGDAGAVTLTAAEARFVDCKFLNNTATGRTTGGGAVRVLTGSEATFVRTELRGNSSGNRGGALEILFSTVAVEGGSFVENRTNPPGHKKTSSGGAIYLLDGTLRVSDARFERNQAGWVGGAIYAFGQWSNPVSVPSSDLTVVRSTFLENQATPNPQAAGLTQGGAIHVEDQTTLRLQHSQVIGNQAKLGGGIDNYRGIVEVTGSLFQGNLAVDAAGLGSGGALFASSNEGRVDGAVNRRVGVVTIADSLIQGGTGRPTAGSGGCLTIGGDVSRAYGENGASQMGTLEENRGRIEIRRSVLADCDAQRIVTAGTGGFGGGLQASLANLLLEDSLVLDSDARGDGAGGGGLSIQGESVATITRTTFARNFAERWGGALFVGGSTIQVSQCRFFGNDVVPGRESLQDSRGAAVYTIPLLSALRPRNVSGTVADSLFSENAGLAVWDVAPTSGPVNEMRYERNQFYETAFSDKVYGGTFAPAGASASGLNNVRSNTGNVRLFSIPVAGTLLAAPSVAGTGAPGAAGSFLHYAWSGRSAALGGQALTARGGLLAAGPGTHALVVDGTQVGSVTIGTATCARGAACLGGGRFAVRIAGARLLAREADTAFFALPGGATVAVQVLDQRDKNGHFWVTRSVSGLSDLSALSGHTLEVIDTATGTARTWALPGNGGDTEADPLAFPAI